MTPAHHHVSNPDDRALLAFSFRERPVFRIGFGSHVRQWDKFMRRQVWARFHNDPGFAAEYQRRVEASFQRVEVNHGY